MTNGRCRFHGGKSTGPPLGTQNAKKHGVWSSTVTRGEKSLLRSVRATDGLQDALAFARIQMHRALRVHKDLQDTLEEDGQEVDADELDRSFNRVDRTIRTLGRIAQQQAGVIEILDLRDGLVELSEEVDRLGEIERLWNQEKAKQQDATHNAGT